MASIPASVIAVFILLSIREAVNPLLPDWQVTTITFFDMTTFAGGFLLIGLMIRLIYHRETVRLEHLARAAQFGELSKGLFHDLMTPLAGLATQIQYTNMIAGSQLNILEKDLAGLIDTGRHLENFMHHLRRTFINPTTNESKPSANLAESLLMAKNIVSYNARINRVQLMLECPETGYVKIHPVRLEQIFLNILHNAIEACALAQRFPEVPLTVRVAVSRAKHGGWQISVIDNGCGMTNKEARAIMRRPFSSKPNGHGYGLIMARSIVERELHGKIKFSSRAGLGTTFNVTIPSSALVPQPKLGHP